MADNIWYYTPVQHELGVFVHSAEYGADGALVSVEEKAQDLSDLSVEHLIDFVAQVAVGITNKPLISTADFAVKVRKG